MPATLSVVIAVHNQAEVLKQNLPFVLSQDYAAFEVIVVDISSSDDTSAVLEQMALRHTNLRYTRTPATTIGLNPIRLALSLGIRQARHEWIVLTQANCRPLTPRWLSAISEAISKSPSALILLGNKKESPRFRFKRSLPVKANGCNVAFSKELFNSTKRPAFSDILRLESPDAVVLQEGSPTSDAPWLIEPVELLPGRLHLRPVTYRSRRKRWIVALIILLLLLLLASLLSYFLIS